MRALNIFATVFLALLTVACNDKNLDDTPKYRVQVTASVGDEVRTTITDDATARQAVVTWAEGDQIGVVAMSNWAISALDLASGAGGRVATFDGEVATQNATTEDYFAFYPRQDEAVVTDGRLQLSLPSEQRNVASGIDGEACGFMVAKCSEAAVDALSFGFENLFAVLKLSIAGGGEQLARVCVTGGAGEKMSGEFTVDMRGEEPVVVFADDASVRTYLLSDKELGAEPTALYIVVPAIEYTAGYSVRVTTSDGRTMVRTVGRKGGRTLQRGVLYNLPMLTFAGEQTDLSLGGRANCYIVSEAGSYCFDCGVNGGVTAELLWEDSEGLISEVGLTSDGYVSFNASEQRGNALLVVRDSNNAIVGSWHIWATEEPKAQTFADGTVALDRNLGAVSPTDIGMYYQWGRRTPFATTPSSVGEGTLADEVSRPDLYISNWASLAAVDRWGNPTTSGFSTAAGVKTEHDPCPAGWRVAQPTFFRSIASLLTAGGGYYTVALDGEVAYFPLTDRLTKDGKWSNALMGYFWTNSNYVSGSLTTVSAYFQFSAKNTTKYPSTNIYANRGYGMNIRCVAE